MSAHLKIQCHIEGMSPPQRAHTTDAGIDLSAYAVEQKRDSVFFFDTGVSIELSEGYYAEIVPRSSIVKTDFIMANSVGIIDPDYRGRLFVPFRFVGHGEALQTAELLLNQRIAQLIVRKLETCTVEVVSSLTDTERGTGGFGSTGI
ncbi:MAG: dUTP diphosphatase [SAR324 cluster bacterium]|nr:dUTP diphosphatase [SAR324 cluster bacterium]